MKLKDAQKLLKSGSFNRFKNQNKLDEWPLSEYTKSMLKRVESKNETFQQIPDCLLGELQENYLKPIDICVYFALKSHAGQDRECWPAISTIAKRCNRSTSTIDGSISRLKERGHIKRKQKKFNGSAYTTLLTYVEKNVVTIGKPLGSENEQSPQPPLEECPFENWVPAPHQAKRQHPVYSA